MSNATITRPRTHSKPKAKSIRKPGKPIIKVEVRHGRKSKNGRAKLNEAAIIAIRANRASRNPTTIKELARIHKVAIPTITHAIYGITWKKVK